MNRRREKNPRCKRPAHEADRTPCRQGSAAVRSNLVPSRPKHTLGVCHSTLVPSHLNSRSGCSVHADQSGARLRTHSPAFHLSYPVSPHVATAHVDNSEHASLRTPASPDVASRDRSNFDCNSCAACITTIFDVVRCVFRRRRRPAERCARRALNANGARFLSPATGRIGIISVRTRAKSPRFAKAELQVQAGSGTPLRRRQRSSVNDWARPSLGLREPFAFAQ